MGCTVPVGSLGGPRCQVGAGTGGWPRAVSPAGPRSGTGEGAWPVSPSPGSEDRHSPGGDERAQDGFRRLMAGPGRGWSRQTGVLSPMEAEGTLLGKQDREGTFPQKYFLLQNQQLPPHRVPTLPPRPRREQTPLSTSTPGPQPGPSRSQPLGSPRDSTDVPTALVALGSGGSSGGDTGPGKALTPRGPGSLSPSPGCCCSSASLVIIKPLTTH